MIALARRLLGLVPPSTVVRAVAGPLRGARWVIGSAPHGAWAGRLERDLLADFAAHVAGATVVWDVGANVGLYTLVAARRVTAAGEVVAFEPLPANLAFLRRHLSLNDAARVRVVPMAVGDTTGHVRMSAGPDGSQAAIDPSGPIEVPVTSLDAWQREAGARLPQVLKIDAEGSEGAILDGAARVVSESRPRIYLAVHGDAQVSHCAATLARWDYDIATTDGRPPAEAAEWIAIPRR